MSENLGYALTGIRETAYWFREPKENLEETEQGLLFSVEHSISGNTIGDELTNLIEVKTSISIVRKQSTVRNVSVRPPFLNLEVVFLFEAEGLDFTSHLDESEGYEYINLPKGLTAALLGIAYSTCRGILFSRSGGSQLHEYLLPVADPVVMAHEFNDRLRKKVSHASDTKPS